MQDRAVRALDDAYVQAESDPLAVSGDRPCTPGRVVECCRCEDDSRAPGGQRLRQRGVVADAARQFHLDVQLTDDGGEQLGIGATAECGIEVDQVDPLRATGLPRARRVERSTVLGLAPGGALRKSNRLTSGHIDSGQQCEGHRPNPNDRG